MPELLLLRHAKSSWDAPGLADRERPLAPRGRHAAPLMGRAMAARGWLPDRAVVSPARRAHETWALVSPELGPAAPEPDFVPALYMAAPDTLLATLRATPAGTRRLIVVGHNPGLEAFAAALAGPRSDAAALAALRHKFPTAAVARLLFDGAWAELAAGAARLTDFVRPKALDTQRNEGRRHGARHRG
ncbi:histidine phosphatase family protein [Aquibium sp. A9E412]|uniref:SixA phosphatase family protein n=1 Tax=Aquibium sp. A9E412 TaxID=2976767 RepID=UPI0025B1CE6A|nr:histidine phosphatase family protein [Aquibium sp. A9E412]MDN2567950.1 histidine phosphatase family protein [Aquibium sp. A9E412]